MINRGYSSIVEVGDRYEFCKVNEHGISCVYYGEVKAIYCKEKNFAFYLLDNGINNKRTGEVFENITAIRGISVHKDTFRSDEELIVRNTYIEDTFVEELSALFEKFNVQMCIEQENSYDTFSEISIDINYKVGEDSKSLEIDGDCVTVESIKKK